MIEIDTEHLFEYAFTSSGAGTGQCRCGRIHVAAMSPYFNGCENELQVYIDQAKTDEDIVINNDDTVAFIEIDGQHYIAGCVCKGWKKYEEFLIKERHKIRRFLNSVSDEVTRIAEQEVIIKKLTKV